MKFFFVFIIIILLLSGCQKNKTDEINKVDLANKENEISKTDSPNSLSSKNKNKDLYFPTEEFKSRITKKPFGVYIAPENSPVQPERFRGYHTGVDAEYGDVDKEVKVRAIADGEVIFADQIDGYGGVIVIKHIMNNQSYSVLYGHLKFNSLPKKNSLVKAGKQIGILGQGHTEETDNERKHLHFSVYTDSDLNFKGYVQNEEDLKKWLDPLKIFEN